jgi:hypothetical protein
MNLTTGITVKITNVHVTPGKLAEAELHFEGDGPLGGLKLIGFGIWERRGGNGRNVTFPARQYSVNGERRAFGLLRAIGGEERPIQQMRDYILAAYAEHERQQANGSNVDGLF